MNKTLDFICSALCGGGISYSLGYLAFLIWDINTLNAIMMLAGMTWVAIATVTAIVGGLVWTARHVRLTIV